jgi:TRAP transporter TAXI family solute receptor
MSGERLSDKLRRRTVLKGIGGASTAGVLAGCSGGSGGGGTGDGSDGSDGGGGDGGGGGDSGDDGGDGGDSPTETSSSGGSLNTEFTFATPGQSTTAYAMASGMSPVIQSESPLTMQAKPTSGSTQAMLQMLNGEVALSDGTDLAGLDAVNGEGDFSGAEGGHPLTAIHSYYWLYFGFLVPTSSDAEYVSDLAGEPVTVGPTGPSFVSYVERALKMAIPEEELDLQYVNFPNWGSNMSSGRLTMAPYLNVAGVAPSYVQQVLSQNDVRMLGWKEENVQRFRESKRMSGAYYGNDNSEYADVSEFTSQDETFQVAVQYLWYANDMVNEATVYELLTTLADSREDLETVHSAFGIWQDLEFWPQHFRQEIPIHPGAAKFYKEHDLWNDDLTVASF